MTVASTIKQQAQIRQALARIVNWDKRYAHNCGLYYKLITVVIDAARSDAPNWSITLMIVIDDAS
jgi:hypothetical protein